MTKLHYTTKHTYNRKGGTDIGGVSQTVQGEVKPIREIIARAMRGELPTKNQGIYLDAGDLEYIDRYYAPHSLDLTDLEALGQHVQRLQNAVETAQQQKAKVEPTPTPEPTPQPTE